MFLLTGYEYQKSMDVSALGARLIEKGFTVEQCQKCRVHALVPCGESWEHDCRHQLVTLTAHHAICTGCAWRYSKVDRYRTEASVWAVYEAAHTATH